MGEKHLNPKSAKSSDEETRRLSSTKISIWKRCPLLYYLIYECKEHEKPPKAVNYAFGQAIHHLLDKFYEKKFKSAESFANFGKHYVKGVFAGDFLKGKEKANLKVREIPHVLASRDKIQIRIGNHVRFHGSDEKIKETFFMYTRVCESMLKSFFERHRDEKPPLEREKRILFDFNGFPMIGILDRIDEADKGMIITDYKTDINPPQPAVLQSNHQFTIYSAAFRTLFGRNERGIIYYHLRSGMKYPTSRGQEHFGHLEKLCERMMRSIADKNFQPIEAYRCSSCDYSQICLEYTADSLGVRKLTPEERNLQNSV